MCDSCTDPCSQFAATRSAGSGGNPSAAAAAATAAAAAAARPTEPLARMLATMGRACKCDQCGARRPGCEVSPAQGAAARQEGVRLGERTRAGGSEEGSGWERGGERLGERRGAAGREEESGWERGGVRLGERRGAPVSWERRWKRLGERVREAGARS